MPALVAGIVLFLQQRRAGLAEDVTHHLSEIGG